ncbi:hypothetical protein FIBSPDRAFT_960133 [Athelia psychrophila]|uniref:F-box domain-containing protein n=1 Tax=Athelia psychrophila TaxID=1759441 RepID=A0A166CSD1_9AGAM|nr:hypothetical protein FIBSPDRAFT_960133 [Fibularhizoctonia sp. CBS 109695]
MPTQRAGHSNPATADPTAYPLAAQHLPLPKSCGSCIYPSFSDKDPMRYRDPIITHPPPPMAMATPYFSPSDANKQIVKRAMGCLVHQKYQVAARLQHIFQPTHPVNNQLIQARRRCMEANFIIDHSYAAYESILPSIRKIPNHILIAIFMECVPNQTDSRIVLALSHVCRRWRDVACRHTPVLWSNISLVVNLHHLSSFQNGANFIELCIPRSPAAYPLRLRLSVGLEPKTYGNRIPHREKLDTLQHHPRFWSLVKALAASAPLWQDVTIASSPSVLKLLERAILTISPRCSFPILCHLGIDLQIKRDEDRAGYPILLFAKAPRLRQVTYSRMDVKLGLVVLPWKQLRHFSAPAFLDLKMLLRLCPNLDHCQALVTQAVYEGPPDLQHKLLQILDLQVSGEGAFELFFGHCALPSLVEMHLHSDLYRPGFWSQSVFDGFLLRSGCTLRKLVLDFQGLTTPDLLAILESVPTLFELHVIDRPTEDLLPSLITSSSWNGWP